MKDFYGENENAVAWPVWTAMLVHLLLRYLAYCSSWKGSHTRFAGVVRAALWERADLMALLKTYGSICLLIHIYFILQFTTSVYLCINRTFPASGTIQMGAEGGCFTVISLGTVLDGAR